MADTVTLTTRTALPPRVKRKVWIRRLLQNWRADVGLGIMLFLITLALLAPVLAPGDPNTFVDRGNLPPSAEHLLGTTSFGQDGFAQLIWGARTSLGIGFATGVVITFLSVLIGMASGYSTGLLSDILSLFTNIFLVIPGLPLAIVMAAYLPPGPISIITVLSISGWAWGARVMRAQTLSLREKDFVAAALVSGESHLRIIFYEILPNMVSLVVANIIGSTIYAISAEVGLEFLGLGNISNVSWGSILFWARSTAALPRGAWWVFLPAGLCVALTGFALALINFALDEITNPRLRKETESKHGPRNVATGPGQPTPVIRSIP